MPLIFHGIDINQSILNALILLMRDNIISIFNTEMALVIEIFPHKPVFPTESTPLLLGWWLIIRIIPVLAPEGCSLNIICPITHLPLVPHTCVCESGQHWLRSWLVAYSAPSHFLNQCWVFFNWTLRNEFQSKFNQNTKFFSHENGSANMVWEMAANLFRGEIDTHTS